MGWWGRVGAGPQAEGMGPRATGAPAALGGVSPRVLQLLTEDALGQEQRGTVMEVVTPMLGCARFRAGAGDTFVLLRDAMS